MRHIVTTTEFEFHERVYIIEAEDYQSALEALQGDDVKPLIDSITRRKIINPEVEPMAGHPSYAIAAEAARAAAKKESSLPQDAVDARQPGDTRRRDL